jgi:hypothetical protein
MVASPRRFAGLALAAALGLSACGPDEDRAAPAASSAAGASQPAQQADPRQELAAAAAKLAAETFRMDLRTGGSMSMTGTLDPKAQNAAMTMDMSALARGTKVEVRKLGNDMYLKFGGSLGSMLGAGGKWMHVDVTRLGAGSSLNVMPGDDPAGSQSLVKAMTDVQRVGEHGYRGTVDLRRTPRYSSGLKSLGARAAAVPFTARTDEQGRLVEITMDMTDVGTAAGKVTTTYSDFGLPVAVHRPAASAVTELPSNLKGMVGG